MNKMPLTGLSYEEVQKGLRKFGLNQIVKPRGISFFGIAKEEITEPMILLLLAVFFFYSIWGNFEDALTILIVILILVFVEIWNEYRAKKAIESLSKIAAPKTKVLREGKIIEIKSEEVVPDDILILTPGTRVSADSKVFINYSLQADESSLTGESFPADKNIGDDIYAGTLIVSGEGKATVFATGTNTKIGKISSFAQVIKEPKTALQIAMKSLAKSLVWIAVFFSVAIPFLGFLRGQNLRQMILTGLSLSFATIPEELPIIITMVLGLGAYKLSKKNFVAKKIRAAEVLGDVTVILTDKTGTITENKVKIFSVFPKEDELTILKTALFALTDIALSPIDKAILEKAKKLDIKAGSDKILRERSFGNGRKTRSILRESDGDLKIFIIGAPEEILRLVENDKINIEEEFANESSKGRRIIAIAQKIISPADKNLPFLNLEKNLSFASLISFEDPLRENVKETIKAAKTAGIRTIMVTGDYSQTASFVAKSAGIETDKILTGEDLDKMSEGNLQNAVKEVSIFARATPEHKYRLVRALQANKEIVAVTGDGINDALALKAADIGIAMGIRGTDAAKEAADVVLADDNFVTIGRGIFEGRRLFDNLRKGIKYYLSVKTALILVFLLPVILGAPLPFAPIQIIILELFMDLAASAGFVAEPYEKTIYTRPPRNIKGGFLDYKMAGKIMISGLSLFAAVMLSYLYALWLNLPAAQIQTFAFSAWIFGHIILAFTSRSEEEPLFQLGLFTNKIIVFWAMAAFAFLFVAIGVPAAGSHFKISAINIGQLGLIFAISFLTIFWQEFKKN